MLTLLITIAACVAFWFIMYKLLQNVRKTNREDHYRTVLPSFVESKNPEFPRYYQSTYAKEIGVKPIEPLDNISQEVFRRGSTKTNKKSKPNIIRNDSKKNVYKKNDSSDIPNTNIDVNLADTSASDDSHKSATSCYPNYSSRSCASPVESYSSSSYSPSSSSDSSSSSSCDSGGSCGGGD